MKNLGPPILLSILITILFALPPANIAQAQPLNEFQEIYSPDPFVYDMYMMKFTYLGPQKKAVLSLGITGMARPFVPGMFDPWEVDYDYSNDEDMGMILTVPAPEWQYFMDMIMGDPALQSTARIPDPNMSVMIFTDTMGPPMCWEHPADRIETDILFQFLEDSVFDPFQKEIIARFRRQMAGVRR